MRKQSFEKLLRDAVRKDAEAQGNLLQPETEPIPAASQARFETALYGKQKAKPNTSASTAAVPVESQSARPQKRFSRVLGYGMAAAAIACIVGLVFGVGLFRGSKKGEGAPSEPMAELNDTHEPKPQEVPPQTTDAPVLPTEQEPPATSEPGPAPGGMPLTPVEELPEIQTEAFTWNGYRCLMIAEYDVLHDVPNIIMFLPKNEEDAKDLPSIVYGLRPEEAFDDWDATPLSEQIDVVLNNTGSGDSDENSVLHSARTVYPNVVCRHVEYDDGYLCYTKVGTDGTKGLILYGLAATETGIDLYDRLVYAFIQMNGYPAKPTGRTEQTAQMRAFFEQNRELLESARTKNPGYYPDLMIEDGRGSYQRPYEDPRAVVETTNLPSELQVLAARSKEEGVTVYWEGRLLRHEPGQPFAEDSEPCFVVTMPESRDEAQSAYEVWLIHTENAQEQFAEAYRDAIEPLWGDWYLYVLYRESEIQLKTQKWQGYSCLFPETFEIQANKDQKLSATEKALLELDMDALQTVGLTDMDYYLVAESMLNGKDLLTWYLTADGWDDKPEDFDTAESVEIAPGIVSVHYYNRKYDSYICIAKLNTIGTNILFLSASSLTEEGTVDFDGIVKQFVEINGDFAPDDSDILNGRYGKSKTFSGKGYQITLTEQFSEQKSEMGFDGYYTAHYGAVMIKVEPFTVKAGLADETLTEYMENVIRNNASDAQPEERDGLIFYRYRRNGMCGWNFAFKGDTAFYLVQFLCKEADESELTYLFFAFARSMTIMDQSGNAVNG